MILMTDFIAAIGIAHQIYSDVRTETSSRASIVFRTCAETEFSSLTVLYTGVL